MTFTTFRHLMLINPRTQKPPVFLGPVFVHMHMRRATENYDYSFHSINSLQPELRSLKAYGTDGEIPLLNALVMNYPLAVGLRCYLHKQHNIEDQLTKKFKVSGHVQKEIIKDIFRHSSGGILFSGIIDASSKESFDYQLAGLRDKWEKLAPGFHKWFQEEHADDFKMSLISSVRKEAQMKSLAPDGPLELFSANANESINAVVKSWVHYKKSSWPTFNDKIRDLVDNQQLEAEKTIYEAGEYELAPEYKFLQVKPSSWHKMSAEERKLALKKFRECQIHFDNT